MSSHGEKLQKQIFISSCFRRHFGSKITHTCSSGVSLFFSELKPGKASWEGFENGKIKLERGRQSEFPTVRHFVTSLQRNEFSSYCSVSGKCVPGLISSSPSKTSDLNPLPTRLLKECTDLVKPPITTLINLSLLTGAVLAECYYPSWP